MTDLIKWFESRRSPMDMIERLFEGETGTSAIRVEEIVDGNTLVVRAELPGIDPEKDVDVTVTDGVLSITSVRYIYLCAWLFFLSFLSDFPAGGNTWLRISHETILLSRHC